MQTFKVLIKRTPDAMKQPGFFITQTFAREYVFWH